MVEVIKKNEDQEGKELIKIVDLDQLTEGNRVFESQGVSHLKVTYKGEVVKISIPIKSSGVSEMIDEFEKDKKPQPPKKRELIKKDSDLGKELRLARNEYGWVFDFTDEGYIEVMDEYSRDLGLKIVMMGLDLPFKDKAGEDVEDDEKRLEILKGMGLTGEHLTKLVDDIQSLTQWQEDKENDFLER